MFHQKPWEASREMKLIIAFVKSYNLEDARNAFLIDLVRVECLRVVAGPNAIISLCDFFCNLAASGLSRFWPKFEAS